MQAMHRMMLTLARSWRFFALSIRIVTFYTAGRMDKQKLLWYISL